MAMWVCECGHCGCKFVALLAIVCLEMELRMEVLPHITYTPLGSFGGPSVCMLFWVSVTKVTLMRQKWFGLPRLWFGLVSFRFVSFGPAWLVVWQAVNAFVFAFCIIYKLNANSQVGKQMRERMRDGRTEVSIVGNNRRHYRSWWSSSAGTRVQKKEGKKSILTDSIYDRWFGFRLPHSLCLSVWRRRACLLS